MITIKPNTTTSIPLNKAELIPSRNITSQNEYTPYPQSSAAIRFVIDKQKQNLFVELSELKQDLDIYLSSAKDASVIGDNEGVIVNFTYTSSTNFGTTDELLFAQLDPGAYYLDIRSNSGAKSIQQSVLNSSGILTFNTKII